MYEKFFAPLFYKKAGRRRQYKFKKSYQMGLILRRRYDTFYSSFKKGGSQKKSLCLLLRSIRPLYFFTKFFNKKTYQLVSTTKIRLFFGVLSGLFFFIFNRFFFFQVLTKRNSLFKILLKSIFKMEAKWVRIKVLMIQPMALRS
jgi:hypothetical protein